MLQRIVFLHLFAALLALAGLPACPVENDGPLPGGTLVFTANGEDFIRTGFETKDNWNLTFDHAYVVIGGPTAFQVPVDSPAASSKISRHAGHPHVGLTGGSAHVALAGTYVVDIAKGTGPHKLNRP